MYYAELRLDVAGLVIMWQHWLVHYIWWWDIYNIYGIAAFKFNTAAVINVQRTTVLRLYSTIYRYMVVVFHDSEVA